MLRERAGAQVVTHDPENNQSHEGESRALSSGMPEVRDQDALALLRRRDARGFDLAYERYAERIFGFLARLSRSRTLAEDLLQHTFLRLAEHGPSLRPNSDLRAWLFSVARNAFHSHVRARGVAARLEATSLPEPGALSVAPESRLAVADLERALGRLSHEDRELLLLLGVEDLSHAEAAEVLGVDQATVRKRVSRARARFAQTLDEEGCVGHTERQANDRAR
jgi:RNA polymerase sigma-70 factor (ECF subfamily)